MTQSVGGAQRRARRVARIHEIATTQFKKGRVTASAATIWRWSAKGVFPKPFKLGPNVTVWDLDEVEAWLDRQAEGAAQ